MQVIFEPSGTHVKLIQKTGQRLLKIRLDFLPEPTEKTYAKHYFSTPIIPDVIPPEYLIDDGIDPNYLASLPTQMILTPALSAFFTIPENMDVASFLQMFEQRITPDDIATIDDLLMLPDSPHYISPFLRNRLKFTRAGITTQDEKGLIDDINSKFASLSLQRSRGANPRSVSPGSIDMGLTAINRASNLSLWATFFRTLLSEDNPANGTGTIDTVEVYIDSAAGNIRAGTFYLDHDTTYVCRDGETLGVMAVGYTEYSGLDIDVVNGDLIGCDSTSASNCAIDADSSGDAGVYYAYGQFCDPLDSTSYNEYAGRGISLYATGTEAGGGGGSSGGGGVTAGAARLLVK